jgi:hypothetical protein
LSLSAFHWLNLLAVFAVLTIPFLLSGLALNTLFRLYPQQAYTLYCFDLAGAACGTIAFFVIAPLFRELEWIALIGCIGFLASAALGDSGRKTMLSLSFVILLVMSTGLKILPEIEVNEYKALPLALKHKNSRKRHEEWNAVSKITWFESPIIRHAPGLSLNYQGELPDQIGIAVDNDMLTAYTNPTQIQNEFIRALPIAVASELNANDKSILIIKALGANTLLPVLRTQAAITIHIDNALLKQWHEKQGYPSNIRFLSGTARSILAHEKSVYNAIFVSLEGSLPSGLSGVGSFKPSSLYTREGIANLLNSLDEEGWLTFHLYLLPPPRSELRLPATLFEQIRKKGLDPKNHVGVFQSISTLLIIYKQKRWRKEDIKTFEAFCDRNSFLPITYPEAPLTVYKKAISVNPLYTKPIYELFDDQQLLQEKSVFNLEPLDDNKPYGNVFLKLSRLAEYLAQFDYKWEAILEGGLLIVLLLVLIFLLSLVTIGFPFYLTPGKWQFISGRMLYFFWIGLGFMCVEIALLEKLTLFLGEPVYSFAITLSSLLLATALGAGRVSRGGYRQLKWILTWVLGILMIYGIFFSHILAELEGLPLGGRLFISVLLIAMVGLALGYFFPFGISQIADYSTSRENRDRQIALAWCYNGIASVVSSVGSMFICLFWGINYLFFLAAVFYLLAYISLIKA